jgi:putative spermidine/putrescine transport system permease protein
LYLTLVKAWAFPSLLAGVEWTGQHWQVLWAGQEGWWAVLWRSVCLSGGLASLATALGFVWSKHLLLAQRREAWLSWALYPYVLSPVVLGAMLQYYFVRLGLTGQFWGVFLAQAFFIFPYAVLLMASFWTEDLGRMALQARSLGATEGQLNCSLLLPLARPWLQLTWLQCFLASWFEYGLTQWLGLGKVETLALRSMQYLREANPHLAALAALLMILPLLLIWWFNERLLARRS